MSDFSLFMKKNKKEVPNQEYAPTKSMLGSDGKPLRWEFKRMSSKENEKLREDCYVDIPITGKPNQYRQKLQTDKYLVGIIVNSTVVPDLHNAELQNSYGVKKPEDLVYAMVDSPGEYAELAEWVQNFNDFNETMEEKKDEAKNS